MSLKISLPMYDTPGVRSHTDGFFAALHAAVVPALRALGEGGDAEAADATGQGEGRGPADAGVRGGGEGLLAAPAARGRPHAGALATLPDPERYSSSQAHARRISVQFAKPHAVRAIGVSPRPRDSGAQKLSLGPRIPRPHRNDTCMILYHE